MKENTLVLLTTRLEYNDILLLYKKLYYKGINSFVEPNKYLEFWKLFVYATDFGAALKIERPV